MRGAILNSHFDFPARRITINLAPADLPKEGGRYDLPIAIGILAASGQIPGSELQHYEFAGELALSGQLHAARGILPMALYTQNTQRILAIPLGEAAEAWALPCQAVVSFLQAIPASPGPGKIELDNRRWVTGFICETCGIDETKDITAYGGWRAYQERNKSQLA